MASINTSNRAKNIQPSHVMDILARAKQLQAEGRDIIHLEVGEPDFATAKSIVDAGIASLEKYQTHYTPATGLLECRQAVADYYQRQFSLTIDVNRIVITSGASAAIQLALLALLDSGDSLLLPDPGYPCNKNIAKVLGIHVIPVNVEANTSYQLSSKHIQENWQAKSRAAIISTPSNPCGSIVDKKQLSALIDAINEKDGRLIVDEIYQGLVYDVSSFTALEVSDKCIVINSFSKYFGMTGWRLGWMVLPDDLSGNLSVNVYDAIDRLAQNLFLAPSTTAQHAAIVALEQSTENILLARRDEFKVRRNYLYTALLELGFELSTRPEGAFYLYAKCDAFTDNSFTWVRQLLEEEGVAITPGIDFGEYQANKYVRFAYTQPLESLQLAVSRIKRFIERKP